VTAVRSASSSLCWVVVKAQVTTIFSVEPTAYGWSVSHGAASALFISQPQALDEVSKRRARASPLEPARKRMKCGDPNVLLGRIRKARSQTTCAVAYGVVEVRPPDHVP